MHTHQDTSRIEQKTLATSLGNWNYAVSHGGDKAILFLHGANSSHLIWHKQFDMAVEGYKNIFVDLLGYGKSDKPEAGYSLSGWIAGLHQILQQEKVSDVCIVAHSNGVIFAKEFYRNYPQGVKQLILLDGMLKLTIKEPVLEWMKATLARSDYEEFMASNVDKMPLQGLEEADKALLRQGALETPKYVVAAEFAVVSDPASWKEMQIDCPTTIVHANNPSWDASYLAALKKIAPQHELLNWTDAGHFIPMQYPERLNTLISSLLRRGG